MTVAFLDLNEDTPETREEIKKTISEAFEIAEQFVQIVLLEPGSLIATIKLTPLLEQAEKFETLGTQEAAEMIQKDNVEVMSYEIEKPSSSNTTKIIVAVVVSCVVLILAIAIFVILRRRFRKTAVQEDPNGHNLHEAAHLTSDSK